MLSILVIPKIFSHVLHLNGSCRPFQKRIVWNGWIALSNNLVVLIGNYVKPFYWFPSTSKHLFFYHFKWPLVSKLHFGLICAYFWAHVPIEKQRSQTLKFWDKKFMVLEKAMKALSLSVLLTGKTINALYGVRNRNRSFSVLNVRITVGTTSKIYYILILSFFFVYFTFYAVWN